jgi:hypothetical protein
VLTTAGAVRRDSDPVAARIFLGPVNKLTKVPILLSYFRAHKQRPSVSRQQSSASDVLETFLFVFSYLPPYFLLSIRILFNFTTDFLFCFLLTLAWPSVKEICNCYCHIQSCQNIQGIFTNLNGLENDRKEGSS